ncbi:P63C domain-containing protein [Microcoleus sp. Pol11C2]|uniref:P63C domain-containing protein n=1 Tax=Microcoleus sp. Pol11C2 TaxID=3055389 RepID=UPI002FD290F2
MDLSENLVFEIIQSNEAFPVNFDDAWMWIGYATKQAAKKKLTRNFEKGLDYSSKWMSVSHSNGSTASRVQQITLTVDCFKSLGMMAGTSKGKEVRAYFLKCEAELKRRLEAERQTKQVYQIKDYVLDKALPWNTDRSGQRPFVTEFYEHLYRIRGGTWAKRNPKLGQKPGCVAGWTNQFVYDMFPDKIPKALQEQYKNQKDTYYRKYEFLTERKGRSHLALHMAALLAVMTVSPANNWSRFLANVQKVFPNPDDAIAIQLEFDFLLEMEESWAEDQEQKEA